MQSQKITVFVVDDDDTFAATIAAFLTRKGYDVREFYTVEDCMAQLKKETPSLIITDYNFSTDDSNTTNGFQFYSSIKDEYSDIPFIVFSGQDDGGLVLKMVREGIRHYIIKDKNMFSELEASLSEVFEH
ncbi:DNA-binding NtrC family response regulator [Catalinimonas alkaloidigena]|uniref:response regulator n=1 Tax=Catalinimonas alkaloidigena TaxID=1075417 RepID=UPI0024051005|nr:response regulator [Catalinimonas alkaloidigena]MDF9799946.1 DNA-binding NtrC family response regulator [Catalinimonas alkaloidigena]